MRRNRAVASRAVCPCGSDRKQFFSFPRQRARPEREAPFRRPDPRNRRKLLWDDGSSGNYQFGNDLPTNACGPDHDTAGVLWNTNGAFPYGDLVQGTNGSFYGTASEGGFGDNGTIFEVTTNGVLSVLDMLYGTNGAAPYCGLMLGADGNFYGTTSAGGADGYLPNPTGITNGYGTVFKMTQAGVLTTIASFHGTNGAAPYGALVEDASGDFYGTTTAGGDSGNGVVFKLASGGGTVIALASFDYTNSGASPSGGPSSRERTAITTELTSTGGTNSVGTVFRVTPAGTLTTLVSFNGVNGSSPAYGALIQGSVTGNFYGTTQSGGTQYSE